MANSSNSNTSANNEGHNVSPNSSPIRTTIVVGSQEVPVTEEHFSTPPQTPPHSGTPEGLGSREIASSTEEAVHVPAVLTTVATQTGNEHATSPIINSVPELGDSRVGDIDENLVDSVIANVVKSLNETVVVDPVSNTVVDVSQERVETRTGVEAESPVVDPTVNEGVSSEDTRIAEEFARNVLVDAGGVVNAGGSITEEVTQREEEGMPMWQPEASTTVNPVVPTVGTENVGVDLLAAAAALSSDLPPAEDIEVDIPEDDAPLQRKKGKKSSRKFLRKTSNPQQHLPHQVQPISSSQPEPQEEEEIQIISSSQGTKRKMTRSVAAKRKEMMGGIVIEEPEVDLEELEKVSKSKNTDKKKRKKMGKPAAEKPIEEASPSKSTRSQTKKRKPEVQGESSGKKKQKKPAVPRTPVTPAVSHIEEDTESDVDVDQFELRRRSSQKARVSGPGSSKRGTRAKISRDRMYNICQKNIIAEKLLAEQTLRIPGYREILENSGLLNLMNKADKYWPELVREFICALHPKINDPSEVGFQEVQVRGHTFDFNPEAINNYYGRTGSDDTGANLPLSAIVGELTGYKVSAWPSDGTQLPSSSLSLKYAIMYKAALTCLVPASNTSNVSHTMGRALYVLGTGGDLNVGQLIYEQILEQVGNESHKKPICFPSLICGLLREQNPAVLEGLSDSFGEKPKELKITAQLQKGKDTADMPQPSPQSEVLYEPLDDAAAGVLKFIDAEIEAVRREKEEKIAALMATRQKYLRPVNPTGGASTSTALVLIQAPDPFTVDPDVQTTSTPADPEDDQDPHVEGNLG